MLLFPWKMMDHLLSHPLNRRHKVRALRRFVAWQVASRLVPGKIAWPFVDNTRLLVRRGMTGATGNIYCGLHEFEEMALVLHALRPDDVFVDVGANVGSYTLLAAGVVGARTISFEPSPVTYEHLLDHVKLNRLDQKVTAHNCALGAKPGQLRFTSGLDTQNHVAVDADRGTGAAIEVPVKRLSDVLETLAATTLIKIDVEGFETEVIAGAEALLRSDRLLGVIMELNGSGSRYGFDDAAVHQKMIEYGFTACRYIPLERRLQTLLSSDTRQNTVYVKDMAEMERRIQSARQYTVLGNVF